MDAKLVSMLKQPIRFPTKVMGTDVVKNNVVLSNDAAVSHLSSTVPSLFDKGDNNATIAIKRLYDSCMREGNWYYY